MPAGDFYLRARYIKESDITGVLMRHASSLVTKLEKLDSTCVFLDTISLETDFERCFIRYVQIALQNKKIAIDPLLKIQIFIDHYYFYIAIDLEIVRVQITTKLKLHVNDSNGINDFSDLTIDGDILWIPYEEDSKLLNYLEESTETLVTDLIRINFTRTNIGLFYVNNFVAKEPYDMYLWEVFHGVALSFLRPAAIGCTVNVPKRLLEINGYQTQKEAYAEPECDHLKIFSDAHVNTGIFFEYILSTTKVADLKSEYQPVCGAPPEIIPIEGIEDIEESSQNTNAYVNPCRMS